MSGPVSAAEIASIAEQLKLALGDGELQWLCASCLVPHPADSAGLIVSHARPGWFDDPPATCTGSGAAPVEVFATAWRFTPAG